MRRPGGHATPSTLEREAPVGDNRSRSEAGATVQQRPGSDALFVASDTPAAHGIWDARRAARSGEAGTERAPRTRRRLSFDIDTGPEGPQVGAFFDLDGTLVAGFSAIAFLRDRLASGDLTLQDMADVALAGLSFRREGLGFSGLMATMARVLRGTREQELLETGERVFVEQLAATLFEDARRLVQAHQQRGHTLAIVTASTRYQAEPVARELGIVHLLCTRLEVKGGRLTGRVLRPTCWGPEKPAAARRFSEAHGVDLAQSYAYSDGYEDLPLLEAVGRPRPTNPDRQLARLARARSWPCRSHARSDRPRVRDAARTGLLTALASQLALAAVPAALASHRSRALVNLCTRAWGALGTAASGIELSVEGRQHLATRPAVFLFNHSSAIDPLLVCNLLQRDFAVLVRPGARASLVFRALLALADGLVVEEPRERGRVGDAEPAVALLRRGLSLVVAPEAGRTPTPRLAAFREGPFRVALEAGVPVVPIVIRNSRDALPPNALVVRPAEIEVRVLQPIHTHAWNRRGLRGQIDAVHDLYARALSDA